MKPIKDRLLEKRVINEDGCWIFTGYIGPNGYGMIFYNGQNTTAHSMSYRTFVGEPKNHVLHKPSCKSKACFNPEHLYDGTRSDNMQDSIREGTHPSVSPDQSARTALGKQLAKLSPIERWKIER